MIPSLEERRSTTKHNMQLKQLFVAENAAHTFKREDKTMVRIVTIITVLACSLLLGGVTIAQDRDRTRDRDQTVLHDQDRLRTQDKLHTQDKDMTRDMVRDRDRDKLHAPGNAGMKTGQGSGSGTGSGRK